MPNSILELFSQREILNYVNNRQYPPRVGESLFPPRKVQSLEFDVLKAGSKIPIAASVHSFDTEAEIGSREASKGAQELGFIKRKMQLKEKDLIALRNPRSAEEQSYLEQEVYNDIDTLVNGVEARVEAMRMEVVADGKITIQENNLDFAVDYHVPAEHKEVLSGSQLWSDFSSDPIANMLKWSAALDVKPTRALTSNDVVAALLKHPAIKDLFKTMGMLPTEGNLNTILQAFKLPMLATYDEYYRKQKADGKYQRLRYFPNHKIVFLPPETLGESIYGPTPEESRLLASGTNDYKVGNVFATVYEENLDPVSTWTKACATAMPSFPEADNVFQAAVLAPEV